MSPRLLAKGRALFDAYQAARQGTCHITLLKTRSELENWLIGSQEDLIVTAERDRNIIAESYWIKSKLVSADAEIKELKTAARSLLDRTPKNIDRLDDNPGAWARLDRLL